MQEVGEEVGSPHPKDHQNLHHYGCSLGTSETALTALRRPHPHRLTWRTWWWWRWRWLPQVVAVRCCSLRHPVQVLPPLTEQDSVADVVAAGKKLSLSCAESGNSARLHSRLPLKWCRTKLAFPPPHQKRSPLIHDGWRMKPLLLLRHLLAASTRIPHHRQSYQGRSCDASCSEPALLQQGCCCSSFLHGRTAGHHHAVVVHRSRRCCYPRRSERATRRALQSSRC